MKCRMMIAFSGQPAPHAPQPLHEAAITLAFLPFSVSSIRIALKGQVSSHKPQPEHSSSSTTAIKGSVFTCPTDNGMDALEIPYFERTVTMSRTGIVAGGTEEFDPWDEVLLYNYIFFSGSKPLSGKWVGLESFPNSLSKRVALEEGCHKRIHQYFAGARSELESACQRLGGIPVLNGHNGDLGFKFTPLPKMPLLLLFWDEDQEEGFEAQAKILFDATALDYLDLEGLTFVAEKLADKLTSIEKGGT